MAYNTDIDGMNGFLPGTFNPTVVTSTTPLTLDSGHLYVYTGSTAAAWTLPLISGAKNVPYFIKNRGSGTITLNCSSSDQLYDTSAVNSISISAGAAVIIQQDGTYWLVL